MRGHLFVVEPEESVVIGKVAALTHCKTEQQVMDLIDVWQKRVGDNFVVLDSRKSKLTR